MLAPSASIVDTRGCLEIRVGLLPVATFDPKGKIGHINCFCGYCGNGNHGYEVLGFDRLAREVRRRYPVAGPVLDQWEHFKR